jgi:hypothetical protein
LPTLRAPSKRRRWMSSPRHRSPLGRRHTVSGVPQSKRRRIANDQQTSASDNVREGLSVQVDAKALQGDLVDLSAHRLEAFLPDEGHQAAAQREELR